MGERVRSRRDETVWKVIEEREMWMETTAPGVGGPPVAIPAIVLRYWKENGGGSPRTGKTCTCRYGRKGTSFSDHWEILYDW